MSPPQHAEEVGGSSAVAVFILNLVPRWGCTSAHLIKLIIIRSCKLFCAGPSSRAV